MVEYFYLEKSYVDWMKNFLDNNNGFVRLYNNDSYKNITEKDEVNLYEIFVFFRKLLRYCSFHNIATNILKTDISDKYKDTYMCFDCSIIFSYEDTLVNMIVLELGGASDMIIRTINNKNEVSLKDIINIDDFYEWINDYEHGLINCLNCSNLIAIDIDYKVHGKEYKCKYYNEICNKEYGFLAKNESRIYPCTTCRRNNNIKFSNN